MRVAQLGPEAPGARRRVRVGDVLQHAGERVAAQLDEGGIPGALDKAEQVADAGAVQRGNKVHLHPGGEMQTPFQFAFDPLAVVGLQAVPLVHRDHQGAAGFQHIAEQMQVLVGDAVAGIDHHHHHLGGVHRLQRLDHGELFDGLMDLATAADAGGVDQHVVALAVAVAVLAHERHLDGIAGGAGLVEHHHPLLAENAVDQGGFAHIGAPQHRHAHGVRVGGLAVVLFRFGKCLEHLGDHAAHAAPVGGGDREQLAEPQAVEVRQGGVRVQAVGFVDRQVDRLGQLAQLRGHLLVGGGEAGAAVHQEQHHVRFAHRLQGLVGHRPVDALLAFADAAGVDHRVGAVAQAAVAVLAVPGEAGEVRHDGVTGAGKAVEQRGFAHIGAAHQGDHGFHWGSVGVAVVI